MGLRWTEGEASRDGFDDRGMLAGSVVRYRSPVFRGGPVQWSDPYWLGFLALHHIDDVEYPTPEAAMAAVDVVHEERAIADLDAGVRSD